MAELVKTISELLIAEIAQGQRLRPVSEAAVSALARVIEEHGFTVPIVVRKTRSGYRLIDGAHRMAAMLRLGRDTIPVRAYTCTDAEARTLETTQNLAGASMSPLDDAVFLAAFGAAYEELHPETRRGAASAIARQGIQTELSSFCEVIAEKRAITPRQVRKIVAAGRRISRDEADQLRGAPQKITLRDVEDIGKIADADQRSAVILRLAAGNAKSAADARRQLLEGGDEARVTDPADEGLRALLQVWSRVPKAARRRFVGARFRELSLLVTDEAAQRDAAEVAELRRQMQGVAAE